MTLTFKKDFRDDLLSKVCNLVRVDANFLT